MSNDDLRAELFILSYTNDCWLSEVDIMYVDYLSRDM